MIDATPYSNPNYVVNSLGYRAPEFNTIDWSNSYVLQGCSVAFGQGIINNEHTISSNLERLLNSTVINLGVSGTGIQFQCMNTVKMLEDGIRPKGIFIVWPNPDRYPYLANDQILNIGSWSEEKYLTWTFDKNSENHNIHQARAYKLLWKLAGVPIYDVTHHLINCKNNICNTYVGEFKDWSTDGQHWGPVMARHVASLLYQKHQSNL